MENRFEILIDGMNHEQLLGIVMNFVETHDLRLFLVEKLSTGDKECVCESHTGILPEGVDNIEDLVDPF